MSETLSNKQDITSREDIRSVLMQFYTSAFDDSIIGFMFTDIAKVDLHEHVDLITQFWASILFAEGSYNNNALQKHVDLSQKVPLKPGHFTRWLYLFERAIDEQYEGEVVQTMKKRARLIAGSISDALTARRGEGRPGVDTL